MHNARLTIHRVDPYNNLPSALEAPCTSTLCQIASVSVRLEERGSDDMLKGPHALRKNGLLLISLV